MRAQRVVIAVAIGVMVGATFGAFKPFHAPNTQRVCPPECNVVLISIDSLRADYLGTYGSVKEITPHIDSWANERANVFDHYTTAAYLTPISEMALHTSLSPLRSGVVRFDSLLPNDIPTMAELLQSRGYYTAAVGSSPEFFRMSDSLTASFQRGFDEYFRERIHEKTDTTAFNSERESTDDAITWLRSAPQNPFFLWVTVGSAHWPYNVEPPFQGYTELTWWEGLRSIYKGNVWSLLNPGQVLEPLSSELDEAIRSAYESNIRITDEFIGDFLAEMESQDLLDSTIVVIQSEHGEDMGEHGHYVHSDIYDTIIKTPLLIYVPGMEPQRVALPIGSTDVLPTIFDYLGIPIPEHAQGRSVRAAMEGEKIATEPVFSLRVPIWESIIARAPGQTRHLNDTKQSLYNTLLEFYELDRRHTFYDVALRTPEWKLIWRKSKDIEEKYGWWQNLTHNTAPIAEYELYNLVEDPLEQENVVNLYPEVVNNLQKQLFDWIAVQEEKRKSPINTGDVQPYF